jgi:tetratricopeptide (TPR) repeat protein
LLNKLIDYLPVKHKFKNPSFIIGVLLFITVFMVYAFTCTTYVGFWDGAEFATSNATFQPTHAAGAPLYTIVASAVMLFFNNDQAALVSALISAIFGAGSCVILYATIIQIVSQVLTKFKAHKSHKFLPIVGGLLGGLTLAFSDTFWTASTEVEVYTLSFFLILAIIYTSLIWYTSTSWITRSKLVLLYFFLLGCAVGVHVITIAIVIPTAVLVVKSCFRESIKNYIIALMVGLAVFITLYFVILQGGFALMSYLDIYLVNTMELPVNSGVWLVIFLFLIAVAGFLYYSYKRSKMYLNHIVLGLFFFVLGASSYLTVMARSNAAFMVAASADNPLRWHDYFKATQFGIDKIPLVNGPVYNAQLDRVQPFQNSEPTYALDPQTSNYVITDDGFNGEINYADEFMGVFPRLFNAADSTRYKSWTYIQGDPISYPVLGVNKTIFKPKFSENLSFFVNYQVYWLNLRYVLWNFVGRQNTNHGLGDVRHGNWQSGFSFIDKHVTGDVNVSDDLGQYHLYGLPLLLGIIGLIFLSRHRSYLIYTIFLFLVFGLGITIYLNPIPGSILIRERDYILIGSFIIYALWIGCSVIGVAYLLRFKLSQITVYLLTVVLFIAAPLQMLFKGFEHHDRTNDSFALNFAKSSLDSCPQNAILITNGDNMTFPLYYLQQVMDYRSDVRVINYDVLNVDTHIDKLKKKFLTSNALKISISHSTYTDGKEKLYPLKVDTDQPVDVTVLSKFIQNKESRLLWNDRRRNYVPGTTFRINIDTSRLAKQYASHKFHAAYKSEIIWSYPKGFYGLNDLILLDIIQNNINDRSICFLNNGRTNHTLNLNSHLIHRGMVNELVPLYRVDKNANPKVVDIANTKRVVHESMAAIDFENENIASQSINVEYATSILRQQYYFLAQAQLEEGNPEQAIETIDLCLKRMPNDKVEYRQFAFTMGKLYVRSGNVEKGIEICTKSMLNVARDIEQITSFDPPLPILNAKLAFEQRNMFNEMFRQFPASNDDKPFTISFMKKSQEDFELWLSRNYPY